MFSLTTRQCVYKGCPNRSTITEGLTYFKFPIGNINRTKKWQKNCGNEEIASTEVKNLALRVICENHFRKEDINITLSRKLLKRHAEPISYFQDDDGSEENVAPISQEESSLGIYGTIRTYTHTFSDTDNNSLKYTPTSTSKSSCDMIPDTQFYCAAIGCNSLSRRDKGVSFHLFPRPGTTVYKDGEVIDLRSLWELLLRCGRAASKSMRACSLHFKSEDFMVIRRGKVVKIYLRKMAIPSQRLAVARLNEREQSRSTKIESNAKGDGNLLDPNFDCCVPGCHTKAGQDIRFYGFPLINLEVCSIWTERIRKGIGIDIDPLRSQICEVHFDYRCKTGNDSSLHEQSLPSLNLPNISEQSTFFHRSSDNVDDPQVVILKDELPQHCRFCFSMGLLYQIETSTYRNKSFSILVNLPHEMILEESSPNACLNCLKSIMISNRLSTVVNHSYNVLKILQKQRDGKIVVKSSAKIFDMKCELALCKLILVQSNKSDSSATIVNKDPLKLPIIRRMNYLCDNNQSCEQNCDNSKKLFSPEKLNVDHLENVRKAAGTNANNVAVVRTYERTKCQRVAQEENSKHTPPKNVIPDTKNPGNDFRKVNSSQSIFIQDILDLESSAERILNDNEDSKSIGMYGTENAIESSDEENSRASEQPKLVHEVASQRIYKCDMCSFSTNYVVNLATHKMLHTTKPFICSKCDEGFLRRSSFISHNERVHPNDIICSFCGVTTKDAEKLAEHATQHEYVQCELCSKVLKKLSYRSHMKLHDKSNRRLCALCGKIVQRQHMCLTGQRHNCKYCSFSTKFRPNFSRHLELHTRNKRFLCTICAEAFHQKISLTSHLKQHDQLENPVECFRCLKQFNTKYEVRKHKEYCNMFNNIRSETYEKYWDDIEKLYICPECNWKTTSYRIFSSHIQNHHFGFDSLLKENAVITKETGECDVSTEGVKFQCVECQKHFKSKWALTKHSKTHIFKMPYKCKLCPRAYPKLNGLKTHVIIAHSDLRPYQCKHCNKSFKTNFYLKVHVQTHSSEKWKCKHCEKSYIHYNNLLRHLRGAHNIRGGQNL